MKYLVRVQKTLSIEIDLPEWMENAKLEDFHDVGIMCDDLGDIAAYVGQLIAADDHIGSRGSEYEGVGILVPHFATPQMKVGNVVFRTDFIEYETEVEEIV